MCELEASEITYGYMDEQVLLEQANAVGLCM